MWPRRPRPRRGWLFPVGDEVSELGYVDMFSDMFRRIDAGARPQETFYDGYVVNAVMDAALPLGQGPRLGADRARLAGRDDAADRVDPGDATRARSSSSARSCRTGATSSSSRTRPRATSATVVAGD